MTESGSRLTGCCGFARLEAVAILTPYPKWWVRVGLVPVPRTLLPLLLWELMVARGCSVNLLPLKIETQQVRMDCGTSCWKGPAVF